MLIVVFCVSLMALENRRNPVNVWSRCVFVVIAGRKISQRKQRQSVISISTLAHYRRS